MLGLIITYSQVADWPVNRMPGEEYGLDTDAVGELTQTSQSNRKAGCIWLIYKCITYKGVKKSRAERKVDLEVHIVGGIVRAAPPQELTSEDLNEEPRCYETGERMFWLCTCGSGCRLPQIYFTYWLSAS